MNILENDLSPLLGHRGRPAALYPFLDLPEAGIQTDREGVLPGDLHSVIFLGIVRCRDLDRGLEPVVGGSEIYHRGRAETDVIDISAGVGYSFHKIFVDLRRGCPAVAADKNLVSAKEFRKEIAHLVGGVTIEVNVIDSAYVICVKCTHSRNVYLIFVAYLAKTFPFAMFINFFEIIFFLIGAT